MNRGLTSFFFSFQLIDTMFTRMNKTFNWSNDLPLFLNVLNGTIVLHCEDTAVLRFCLAILINTSKHFKHIFSTSGSVDLKLFFLLLLYCFLFVLFFNTISFPSKIIFFFISNIINY